MGISNSINLSEIPQSLNATCSVWFYRAPHSLLVLRVDEPKLNERSFWLMLEGVAYFEGVFQWRGLSLSEVSLEMVPAHVREIVENQHVQLPQLHFIEITSSNRSAVKILAARLSMSTENYTLGDFFA
jgi:hypothetical protein